MNKIKEFLESGSGRSLFTILIIILVGLSSYGLGRLSKNVPKEGIRIEYREPIAASVGGETGEVATKSLANITTPKTFFASVRGKKYYSIGCSGGKTIKQENKIYFSTKEEAEGAGYELSATCK